MQTQLADPVTAELLGIETGHPLLLVHRLGRDRPAGAPSSGRARPTAATASASSPARRPPRAGSPASLRFPQTASLRFADGESSFRRRRVAFLATPSARAQHGNAASKIATRRAENEDSPSRERRLGFVGVSGRRRSPQPRPTASRLPVTPSFCRTAETWWSTVRTESDEPARRSPRWSARGEQAQDLDLPVGEPGRVHPGRGLAAARDHRDARPSQVAPHAGGGRAGAEFVEDARGRPAVASASPLGQLQRRARTGRRSPATPRRPPASRRGCPRPAPRDSPGTSRRARRGAAASAAARRAGVPHRHRPCARPASRRPRGRRRAGRAATPVDLGQQRGHQFVASCRLRRANATARASTSCASSAPRRTSSWASAGRLCRAAPDRSRCRSRRRASRAQPGLGGSPVAAQRLEPVPMAEQVLEVVVQLMLAPVADGLLDVLLDLGVAAAPPQLLRRAQI